MHSVSTLVLSFFTFLFCSGLTSGACPPIYTEIGGGCFLVVETPFDFISARAICRSYNGDLAVVSDCALLSSLSEYLQASYEGTDVWVGASDLASEDQWYWIDGTLVEFGAPYWARESPYDFSQEPSGGTAENCAMMSVGAGYYFQDRACNQNAAALCEAAPDPTSGSCPGLYEHVGDSNCFEFLSTVDATWDDARIICQSSGGDLAIIDDCHLMESVIDFSTQNDSVPVDGFWIGGSDAASEGTWTWLDGSDMDMSVTFWGRSGSGDLQPNSDPEANCLILWNQDRFLYANLRCAGERFPLCQAEPIKEK